MPFCFEETNFMMAKIYVDSVGLPPGCGEALRIVAGGSDNACIFSNNQRI